MKKLATLLVALVASISTFAQVEKGTITLQPMVGLTETSFTADAAKFKVGFIGGVEGAYQISDRVGVSLGVLYAMQGAKYDYALISTSTGSTVGSGSQNVNLNTLNIPVLCNVYVWKGLAVKAGVQPEIVLSAKVGDKDVKSDYSSTNVSIPVGASYDFPFGLTVDARYNIGLTNVWKGDESSASNMAFQITAGYKFKL